MGKQPRGAILLDGIEYLVSNNSFDAVLMFVRRLLDAISESRYAFIISLGPATLKDQELKVLEREMEGLPPPPPRARPPRPRPPLSALRLCPRASPHAPRL